MKANSSAMNAESEYQISGTAAVKDGPPSDDVAGPPTGTASRCPTRKRKLQDIDMPNLEAAPGPCICGDWADPKSDAAAAENVAICVNPDCHTRWFHLRCLQLVKVPNEWMCAPCMASGNGREKRRNLGGSRFV
ncbi:hypothetical protein DFH06DRAFT_1327235 [Mycena polygramma]|nr:hypothetical protein DFH06DRAFT_1327235 [Mycena polygramma]